MIRAILAQIGLSFYQPVLITPTLLWLIPLTGEINKSAK